MDKPKCVFSTPSYFSYFRMNIFILIQLYTLVPFLLYSLILKARQQLLLDLSGFKIIPQRVHIRVGTNTRITEINPKCHL